MTQEVPVATEQTRNNEAHISADPEVGHGELSPNSDTKTYALKVDPNQDDRASEIKLFSTKRPHMRAFHYAWWCYHVAFMMWFAISPLLSEVKISLDLTKEEIWTSSITAASGSILMRFVLGPFVDKYGPRIPMGIVLFCAAIPTGMIGLVETATGLAVLRFIIGFAGSTFIMCAFWTSNMFTREWVGTATATAAGWGNLGGATTQLLVGTILFPLFKNVYNGNAEKAWRTVCVFPAIIGLITAYCVVKFTDDSPKGSFATLKKEQKMTVVNISDNYLICLSNVNTWLLFVQYACCFGVEITMNNAAALYFTEEFGQSTESAAAIASVFGWMNLFARGLGGYMSDKANGGYGMPGRLAIHSFVLLMEGIMVIIFAYTTSLVPAIIVLVVFSCFVQAAEGTSFGIVPYIKPSMAATLSGIVGAGGNVGAVSFGICFRELSSKSAFIVMGSIIMFSSILSIFVFIPDHPGLLWKNGHTHDSSSMKTDQNENTDLTNADDNTPGSSEADDGDVEVRTEK